MILNPGYGFILGGEARAFAQTLIINTWDLALINNMVGWPNGKALDYESRDCRFDPCVDQNIILIEDSPLLLDLGQVGLQYVDFCLFSFPRGSRLF